MDGQAFIAFAGKVAAQNSGAAGYRSAVSRAYYGAYHLAIALLNDFGFHCREQNEHRWVQHHFYNCSTPEAHAVGILLGNLHESRKGADYDLGDAAYESQQMAQTCVLRATEIAQQLDRCAVPETRLQVRQEMVVFRQKTGCSV